MNPSHILPIFVIIIFAIIVIYRISLLLTASVPRRTRMIRVMAIVLGLLVVITLGGLQIFHVIP